MACCRLEERQRKQQTKSNSKIYNQSNPMYKYTHSNNTASDKCRLGRVRQKKCKKRKKGNTIVENGLNLHCAVKKKQLKNAALAVTIEL